MKKLVILCLCLLLSGCMQQTKDKTLYKSSTLQAGFDTVITLQLYADSEEKFNETFQIVAHGFLYFHQLFDKYNDYDVNNIKTINDNAGIQPVEVNQEIIDLLLLAKKYSEISNNQFNITLGPVLELWHDVREKAENGQPYTLPTEDELNKAYVCSGWDKVKIDDDANTVYLTESCSSLDVGAIAKGYAAQKVADYLKSEGFNNGIIDAGGNIQFLGPKITNEPWVVGVTKPTLKAQNSIVRLNIAEENAFVTSGDYQRYFIHNDEIMHHIIDPETLYPSKHARSVTILTKDSGIADILSTTLYTMTYQEGKALIEQLNQSGVQAEVLWIYDTLDEIKNETYIEKDGFYMIHTPNIELITEY